MSQAKDGDQVKVHYTGTLEDGSVFDTSADKQPLAFTLGSGQVIAGFEEAVLGMAVGEKKTVTLPPEKAYGDRMSELVLEVPISQIPEDIKPEVGQRLQVANQQNQPIIVIITEVTEQSITLDANPPLAGKELTFELELVEID